MNEKITELAEQSGAINDADYWGDEYFVLKGVENIEKFAELIIQECLNIVEATSNESADLGRTVLENSVWINSDINRYFGIK